MLILKVDLQGHLEQVLRKLLGRYWRTLLGLIHLLEIGYGRLVLNGGSNQGLALGL